VFDPRYKVQSPYNFGEMYDEYIKDVNEDSPYWMDRGTFVKVGDKFYKEAVQEVLNGKVLYLPFGLGRIRIIKKKLSNYKRVTYINWKESKLLGKRVYHLNEHSDGYNYFIKWDNKFGVNWVRRYNFVPTRNFKRTLARIIKNKESDYFEDN
jgi:hypothetical protein